MAEFWCQANSLPLTGKGREGVVIAGESKTAETRLTSSRACSSRQWVRLRGLLIVSLIGQDQTLTFSN
jgi:hypothetical protein